MKEDIKFDKISKLFTKILIMFGVIQEWGDENHCEVEGYYLPEGFKDDLFTFTSQFKVTDCKNLTAEIRLIRIRIYASLGTIEYVKAEKEESQIPMIDNEDLEKYIQAYDDKIREMKSKLLQSIKTEIVNFAM